MATIRSIVCPLGGVSSKDLSLVGGKAANLGELVRAGFSVPAGFCIAAAAYDQHVLHNRLLPGIVMLLETGASDDIADVAARATKIRRMIEEAEVPPWVRAQIEAAYKELTSTRHEALLVAVRSSATTEDLPGASFAGQQETYLHVRGADQVMEAVKRCWSSLWTARAISYRQAKGFEHLQASVGVVIQEMVSADVAGVMFTANPATNALDEIVINASWGLGETVVSGAVSPDEYTLGKADLQLRNARCGEKTLKVVRNPALGYGTAAIPVARDEQAQLCLSSGELTALAAIGQRIEKHFGVPQDIEWARAQGSFRILQSRDITTLDLAFGDDLNRWNRKDFGGPEQDVVWTRAIADEISTGPCSPLMYSLYADLLTWMYGDMDRRYGYHRIPRLRLFTYYKARPYVNCMYFKEFIQYRVPKFVRTDAVLQLFPPSQREEIKRLPFYWASRLWAHVRARKNRFGGGLHWAYTRYFPQTVRRHAELDALDLQKASLPELLSYYSEQEKLFRKHSDAAAVEVIDHCFVTQLVVAALLRRWCGDESGRMFAVLASGLPRNKTQEQNIRLWRLSRLIRESSDLKTLFERQDVAEIYEQLAESEDGRRVQEEIAHFLVDWGHRGGAERDCMYPRWGEKPAMVVGALRPLVAADESADPEKREQTLLRRREEATVECFKTIRRQPGGMIKVLVFRRFLRWMQRLLVFREDERHYGDFRFLGWRNAFLGFGLRYAEMGILDQAGDIWFLSKEEVFDIMRGRIPKHEISTRICARRRLFEKYGHNPPAKFLRAGRDFDDDVEHGKQEVSSEIIGRGVSPGTTRGPARVCLTLEDTFGIRKGDILVANATDPAWSAVFALLGGVVVETGGILSHATITAREYGIPCVTDANRATKTIRDGETVIVDGDNGRVILVEREVSHPQEASAGAISSTPRSDAGAA